MLHGCVSLFLHGWVCEFVFAWVCELCMLHGCVSLFLHGCVSLFLHGCVSVCGCVCNYFGEAFFNAGGKSFPLTLVKKLVKKLSK